jgi:hypothetical protein
MTLWDDMNAAKLQRLELASDLFPAVMSGKKTDTLRVNDEGPFELGFLEFYSKDNPSLKAQVLITGVQKGTMSKFASRFRVSADQLLQQMQKHYPDITIDVPLTLVEFMSPQETEALTS